MLTQTADPSRFRSPPDPVNWDAWRGELAGGTRAAHHRLDHHPVMATLARPDLSTNDYLRALQVFAQIWAEFGLQFPWAQPIAEAAAKDLAHWNYPPLIQAVKLPMLHGPAAEAWQYVMWGSSRGGKFLLRSVHNAIPDAPHFFFSALTGIGNPPFSVHYSAEQCLSHAIDCFQYWIDTCEKHL